MNTGEGQKLPYATSGPPMETDPWMWTYPPAVVPTPAPPRSGIWRSVTLALVSAVLLGSMGAAAVIAVEPDEAVSSERAASAGNEAGAPPPYAEIEAILTRRSEAVRTGDEQAFLADIDPTSAAFVKRQQRLFENLQQLPLDTALWQKVSAVEEPTTSLVVQYGTLVYVWWVEFDYRLKGFDTGDVAVPMAFTFAQREGRWMLSGDHDIRDLPVAHGPDIWDQSAIAVARGERSLVIGTAADRARLKHLAALTDEAARRAHRLWSDLPEPKVVVYLPRDPQSRKDHFARAGEEQFEGVEFPVKDRIAAWTNPAWPTSTVGTRVVLNAKAMDSPAIRSQRDGLARLILHEVTHVATSRWTGAGAPTWVVEGSAEYTAFRDDIYGHTFPSTVFDAARRGHLLPALATGKHFYDSPDNYDRVYLLYAYIRLTYGEDDIVRLYRLAGPVADPKRTKAKAAAAVQRVFGFSEQKLLRRFNAWAQVRVRPVGAG